jgi:hypothetical protein
MGSGDGAQYPSPIRMRARPSSASTRAQFSAPRQSEQGPCKGGRRPEFSSPALYDERQSLRVVVEAWQPRAARRGQLVKKRGGLCRNQ